MASKARPVVNNENALNAPTSQSNVSVEQYLNMVRCVSRMLCIRDDASCGKPDFFKLQTIAATRPVCSMRDTKALPRLCRRMLAVSLRIGAGTVTPCLTCRLSLQECEKLITQLGKIADERIEEFLAKARMTRTELEKTLLASKQ